MTLRDVSTGPGWVGWIVFGIFAILTLILLSGHGGKLIAGYNTASDEQKADYDEKKISKITGGGMAIITILIFVMLFWENVIPARFASVFGIICLIDCVVIIIMMNTIGKRKR